MKKRISLIVVFVLVASIFVSCTTSQVIIKRPFAASVSFPASGTYKVLGRVEYAPSQNTAGYLDFLSYAKTIYPETDDVVNILVDSEETYVINPMMPGSTTNLVSADYLMSGIAIQYLP